MLGVQGGVLLFRDESSSCSLHKPAIPFSQAQLSSLILTLPSCILFSIESGSSFPGLAFFFMTMFLIWVFPWFIIGSLRLPPVTIRLSLVMGNGVSVVFTVPYWLSYSFYLALLALTAVHPVILTDSTGSRDGLGVYFWLVHVPFWVVGLGLRLRRGGWKYIHYPVGSVGLAVLGPSPQRWFYGILYY